MAKTETLYYCCDCNDGPMLEKNHPSCLCGHRRCSGCQREFVKHSSTLHSFQQEAAASFPALWDTSSSPLLSAIYDPQSTAAGDNEDVSYPLDLSAPIAELVIDAPTIAAIDRVSIETPVSEPSVTRSAESNDGDDENSSTDASTDSSSASSASSDDESSASVEGSNWVASSLPAPDSPRDTVIHYMIAELRSWLHAHLRQAVGDCPLLGANSQTNTAAIPSLGNASSSSVENSRRESSKRKRSSRKEDDDDDDGMKRTRQKSPAASSEVLERFFACHFWKRKPRTYLGRRWKSCRGPCPGWTEVHRVKQHLLDYHVLKPRCGRCGDQFDSQALVDAHLQREETCTRRQLEVREGISTATREQLKHRRGLCKMTSEEKWMHWYRIIFPHDDHNSIPSPYYEPSQPSISQYESFLRYDLVPEVQLELEQIVPAELHDRIPRLANYLRSAVEIVHERFVTSQITNIRSNASSDEMLRTEAGSAQVGQPHELLIGGAIPGGQNVFPDDGPHDFFDTFSDNFLLQFGAFESSWLGVDNELLERDQIARLFDPEVEEQ